MYRISYRFLVPGWSAKPLVSAHYQIMGTHRLDTKVILKFDGYPMDLQARASTFKALAAGGGAVNEALATSGLLGGGG